MAWQFDDERPIYTQLLEKIRVFIISGQYPPGSKLPPVRELAAEASVNPNTMQKAFAELERTGLIYTQRTAGRFVTEDEDLIRQYRQRIALEKIEEFMKAMSEMGYTREEVMVLMERDREKSRAADQEKDRTADARFDEAARIDEKEAAPQEAQKGEMDL